jgi:hypothetical protein
LNDEEEVEEELDKGSKDDSDSLDDEYENDDSFALKESDEEQKRGIKDASVINEDNGMKKGSLDGHITDDST